MKKYLMELFSEKDKLFFKYIFFQIMPLLSEKFVEKVTGSSWWQQW